MESKRDIKVFTPIYAHLVAGMYGQVSQFPFHSLRKRRGGNIVLAVVYDTVGVINLRLHKVNNIIL